MKKTPAAKHLKAHKCLYEHKLLYAYQQAHKDIRAGHLLKESVSTHIKRLKA